MKERRPFKRSSQNLKSRCFSAMWHFLFHGLQNPADSADQKARSARGVNLLTNMQDLMAYVFAFAYSYSEGHPFSAYGETLFQGIGTLIITSQIFYFERKRSLSYVSRFVLWNGRLQLRHVQIARNLWSHTLELTFKSVKDNNYYFRHYRETAASAFELS